MRWDVLITQTRQWDLHGHWFSQIKTMSSSQNFENRGLDTDVLLSRAKVDQLSPDGRARHTRATSDISAHAHAHKRLRCLDGSRKFTSHAAPLPHSERRPSPFRKSGQPSPGRLTREAAFLLQKRWHFYFNERKHTPRKTVMGRQGTSTAADRNASRERVTAACVRLRATPHHQENSRC